MKAPKAVPTWLPLALSQATDAATDATAAPELRFVLLRQPPFGCSCSDRQATCRKDCQRSCKRAVARPGFEGEASASTKEKKCRARGADKQQRKQRKPESRVAEAARGAPARLRRLPRGRRRAQSAEPLPQRHYRQYILCRLCMLCLWLCRHAYAYAHFLLVPEAPRRILLMPCRHVCCCKARCSERPRCANRDLVVLTGLRGAPGSLPHVLEPYRESPSCVLALTWKERVLERCINPRPNGDHQPGRGFFVATSAPFSRRTLFWEKARRRRKSATLILHHLFIPPFSELARQFHRCVPLGRFVQRRF